MTSYPDLQDKCIIFSALGDIGDTRVVPDIKARLTELTPPDLAVALLALSKLGAQDIARGYLTHDDPVVCRAAMLTLKQPPLGNCLEAYEQLLHRQCHVDETAGIESNPASLSALFEQLIADNWIKDPIALLSAISKLADHTCITPLLKIIASPRVELRRPEVRKVIGMLFGRLGNNALEPMLALLQSGKAAQRQIAIIALAELNYPAQQGVFIKALADSCWFVKREAIIALGHLHYQAATEYLLAMLAIDEPYQQVRLEIIRALGSLGDETTALILLKYLRSGHSGEPLITAAALSAIAQKCSMDITDEVIPLLRSDHEPREAGIILLGNLGDNKAIAPLMLLLKTELGLLQVFGDPFVNANMRHSIILALGKLKANIAIKDLLVLLNICCKT